MDSPCTVKMGPVWLISLQHGKDGVSLIYFIAAQSTGVTGGGIENQQAGGVSALCSRTK